MNKLTYEKLKNNPHYKMSKKQKEEAEQLEKEEQMITFGIPPIHNAQLPIHDTKLKRKGV